MNRFLMTLGVCFVAQTGFAGAGFAGENDRPEARPMLCKFEGSTQFERCTVMWDAANRVAVGAVRSKPAVIQASADARKITRMPWTIGVFQ